MEVNSEEGRLVGGVGGWGITAPAAQCWCCCKAREKERLYSCIMASDIRTGFEVAVVTIIGCCAKRCKINISRYSLLIGREKKAKNKLRWSFRGGIRLRKVSFYSGLSISKTSSTLANKSKGFFVFVLFSFVLFLAFQEHFLTDTFGRYSFSHTITNSQRCFSNTYKINFRTESHVKNYRDKFSW